MNTPTETLAERLTAHNAWRRGETDEQPISATLLGKTLDHAASRLLAQHETMTKQDERIAALQAELEEVRGYYEDAFNSERMWRAKADRYWQELEQAREANVRCSEAHFKQTRQTLAYKRELEQERQDRKQADLDTIRALGERNDARTELDEWKDRYDGSELTHAATRADLRDCKLALQAERALADRLANELSCLADWRDAYKADCHYDPSALNAYKEARRE